MSGLPALTALAVAALLAGCRALGAGPADPGLVSFAALAPEALVQMRYAGSDNFTGGPVAGYQEPVCLLTEPAARALAAASRELRQRGLRLVVFDCYRPQRAVDQFVRWAREPEDAATRARFHPRVPRAALFAEGYIAEHSGHSRGSTVDVGLASAAPEDAGALLDLGTPFDFFDPRSHTEAPEIQGAPRAWRLLLRSVMERHGFQNYEKEWWHFTLRDEPWPATTFDVPVRPP